MGATTTIDTAENQQETINQDQQGENVEANNGTPRGFGRGVLITALAAARLEFEQIKMSGKNPTFGNKYAKLEDIIKATAPALARHGLVVAQTTDQTPDGELLITTLWHTSGESLYSETAIIVNSAPDNRAINTLQREGIVRTYKRRYELAAMLGVAGEEDVDGNEAGPEPAKGKGSGKAQTDTTTGGAPGTSGNGNGDGKLTETQRKHIFGLAKSRAINPDTLKTMIKDWFSLESTNDLTKPQYDTVVENLTKIEVSGIDDQITTLISKEVTADQIKQYLSMRFIVQPEKMEPLDADQTWLNMFKRLQDSKEAKENFRIAVRKACDWAADDSVGVTKARVIVDALSLFRDNVQIMRGFYDRMGVERIWEMSPTAVNGGTWELALKDAASDAGASWEPAEPAESVDPAEDY